MTGVDSLAERVDAVAEVLADAQRLGFLGARPIPEVVAHAAGFVLELGDVEPDASRRPGGVPAGGSDAVPPIGVAAGACVVDIGSGGGVPGLVIAAHRPDLRVVLADRRAKRTDFLRRAVRRLGWDDHVEIVTGELPLVLLPRRFDVVVARGFAEPRVTAAVASALVRPAGLVLVTSPPEGDGWTPEVVAAASLHREPSRSGQIVRLRA